MANYLKEKTSNLSVYGVDVDYSNKEIFSALYKNMNVPRKISDNEFAKIFIANRNRAMAEGIEKHFRNRNCTKAVLSAGNMHIHKWNGDAKVFPNYSGGSIPGIADLLNKEMTGKPFIVDMYVSKNRKCPQSGARVHEAACTIKYQGVIPRLRSNYGVTTEFLSRSSV